MSYIAWGKGLLYGVHKRKEEKTTVWKRHQECREEVRQKLPSSRAAEPEEK